MEQGIWLAPISLLPAVGLLILSTSTRYLNVVSDIQALNEKECETQHAQQELKRALLFRNALVSLYVSVCFLSTSALLGGMALSWGFNTKMLIGLGSGAAIAGVVYASVALIRESAISLEIVQIHTKSKH